MNNREFDEEEEEEKYGGETGDLVTVIEEKLSELVHCLYPTTEKKCSLVLLDFSRILRQANKETLKSVIHRYVTHETSGSDTEYRKFEILLDVLPTLPSPDSAKVLIELIREHKISELRGAALVKVMTMMVKPTPMVIKSVLELFKELPENSKVLQRTLLRQSLLLGVGTLTHRLITVMRSHGKPIPEVITFIDSFSSELKRMMEETSTESQKILILKSLGNMGASETIPFLKSLIEDSRLSLKVRITAVFALRRLAKQYNKLVVPTLMGVFMDTKEVVEVRQACFIVIIDSNPTFSTLQMISHRLRHEPSSQIRTLVYSSLINLAMYKSHEPEHKTLIKNARLIIKTMQPVKVGLYDSMSLLVNPFSEELDIGGALNIMKIKSRSSGLPEALAANLQATLFGKHRRFLEVGVVGKSLEQILRKTFGPHGLLKDILKGQVSISDVFKPLMSKNLGGVQEKVRKVLTEMMYELKSEEHPFASWYIRLLGNELQYIVLNSENVEDIIEKVTNFVPKLLSKLNHGMKVDIVKSFSNIATLTIASPIGIPLSLNFTTMAILKVDGHVKVNNLPTWSDMVNKFSMPLQKISLDMDVKPVIDFTHVLAIGADMRWLASGVGVQGFVHINTPLKLSVHVDPSEHTLSVKYFTPKETLRRLYAKIMPVTFVKHIPTTLAKLPYHIEIKEIKNEQIVKLVPYERRFKCSITGQEVEARGAYSLCGPSWCPIFPLFGRQEVTVTTRPVYPIEYVHLKMKSLKSNIEYEGVPASMSTDELFDESEEDDEEPELNSYRRKVSTYRRSSRSMIESGEFEPITVDPIFKNEPIKRQLLITLGPNNEQSSKIKTLITWLMGRQSWKHQLNVQVSRLAHHEAPVFKMNFNKVVNPEFWYGGSDSYRTESGEFLSKMHLKWNVLGYEKDLKAKIIAGSPFDFTRELNEHRILTIDNLPVANAQKYQYTLEVDVPPMSPKGLRYLTIVQDFIKFHFYSRLTTSIPKNPHSERIIVAVEALPWWEQANVIIKTPRENNYISGVPFYWNPFLPTNQKIKLHDHPAWKWYGLNTTEEEEEEFTDTVPYKSSPVLGDTCHYSELTKKIVTFDGVKLPVSALEKFRKRSCSFVFAQHCSNDGLFSVIKSGGVEGTPLKVKVIMPKYEIEWISHDYKMELLVNGEPKTLHNGQPIVLGEDENTDSRSKLYKIEMIDHQVYELKAYELGFTLLVDKQKKSITLKLSPFSMLQGQLCGLCGNYNQDQSDDYNTETDFQTDNRDFYGIIKNSMVRSETCDYEKISPLNDDYCLKESHLTIQRYESETPMTCSSEHKVPQCARGCRPEHTKSIKTCFTCRTESGQSLPRNTYSPPRWDRDDEGVTDCVEFFQRVEVPTRCVPVY